MKNNGKTIKLLSIREVAEILGVSFETLYNWDESGKLKSIRLTPRARRQYKIEDIEKFVAEGGKK